MRKNLVNKKVVSSIGVGIMAFVTATSPVLTVLAEDVDAAPAPEPAPVVETNTPAPQAQGQTESAPSEQSKAVGTAQTAVSDAQVKDPANDTLADINQALDNANQALENIAGNVTELDDANQAVNDANQTLADGMAPEGYGEEIGAVEGAADTVDEKVGSLTDTEVDEAVTSAEEKADNAEDAAEKTHENAQAAEDAKKQVGDDLAKVEETDGVLDKVESAEDALDQVGTQVTILQGVLDANQTAKDAADTAAGNAETALNNVLSDGMKEMTDEAKEELQSKVQAVTDTQNSLQTALDVNKENIAALKDRVHSLDSIDEAEKEELATLIGKLSEFDTLNEYEQEKCLDNLGKYTDVTILLDEEEKSIADWVSGYMGAYTAALQAHVEALETLVEQMNGLSDTLTDDAKNALVNVNTALEAAKNYEEDSLAAYNQITEVTDAAVAVQRAQDALDTNTNLRKEELIKDENGDGEQKGKKQIVKDAYEAYKETERLEKEIKEKEEELNTLNIATQASQYWDIYWQIEDLKKDLKEEKKKNPEAHNNYFSATDDLAKLRIEYILIDEGATNIKIPENFVSDQGDNNYIPVTYTVKDKDGKEYTRTEYFDYTHVGADITIVRKEAISKAADGHELGVTIEDGKPVYRYGNNIIQEEDIIVADNGYYINGVTEPVTIYTFKPASSLTEKDITLTMIKKLDGSFIYTLTGGTIEEGESEQPSRVEKDNERNVTGFWYRGRYYGSRTGIENDERPAFFENTDKFTDKGDRPVDEKKYSNKVEQYISNKEQSQKDLEEAIRKLNESVNASESLDTETKNKAKEYLDDEEKDAEKIGNVVKTATNANSVASDTWNTSKDVKNGVSNAYLGVAKAIQSLLDAMANRAETGDYDAIAEAVEKHQKASDKLNDPRFGDLKTARDILEDVLGRTFRYNTPGTTPETPTTPGGGIGGTTGGGTGGTTGGGAGGTGGGAADAAIPAAAPVVNIPATAVPLAGPTVADAVDEDEDGAEGLTTLEDEVTPLAGPEETAGSLDLTNFPMPGIGTVAKAGQMSWWWLLIVALFGATGAEMYRRHQKKQREEANIEN